MLLNLRSVQTYVLYQGDEDRPWKLESSKIQTQPGFFKAVLGIRTISDRMRFRIQIPT
jgi:hypothetical protein